MKIWVVGVTLILAAPVLTVIPAVVTVGAVIAVIGAVMYCLDK